METRRPRSYQRGSQLDFKKWLEPSEMTSPPTQAVEVIQNWMLSNIKKQGYERYDDLHIDQIDQRWKARDSWIEGGFEAFRLAVDIRNQHAPSFSVVLAFSLTAGDEPQGLDFRTLQEMNAELSSSPPSVYLFQKGKEPWTETGLRDGVVVADNIMVENMSPDTFGSLAQTNSCYYMEFRQIEFGEYSRSIFVAG